MDVRPFCAESRASWTILSDSESNAEVASSNRSTGGFLINALKKVIINSKIPNTRINSRKIDT